MIGAEIDQVRSPTRLRFLRMASRDGSSTRSVHTSDTRDPGRIGLSRRSRTPTSRRLFPGLRSWHGRVGAVAHHPALGRPRVVPIREKNLTGDGVSRALNVVAGDAETMRAAAQAARASRQPVLSSQVRGAATRGGPVPGGKAAEQKGSGAGGVRWDSWGRRVAMPCRARWRSWLWIT